MKEIVLLSKDRLRHYRKALSFYKSKGVPHIIHEGLCYCMVQLNKEDDNIYLSHIVGSISILVHYPELLKQKPNNTYTNLLWFKSGLKKPRIKILQNAISELRLKLKPTIHKEFTNKLKSKLKKDIL